MAHGPNFIVHLVLKLGKLEQCALELSETMHSRR